MGGIPSSSAPSSGSPGLSRLSWWGGGELLLFLWVLSLPFLAWTGHVGGVPTADSEALHVCECLSPSLMGRRTLAGPGILGRGWAPAGSRCLCGLVPRDACEISDTRSPCV